VAEQEVRFADGNVTPVVRVGDTVCCRPGPWTPAVHALLDHLEAVGLAAGKPIALIDWDLAAPAPRLWDVAHALWRFAPLHADATFGSLAERARRIALFCDAYGLDERRGLLDAIERRQRALYDTLAAWGEAGEPGFAEMWRDGHGDGVLADLTWLCRHRGTR